MTEVAIRLCKRPLGKPFLVRQIFTDFKRDDVGPGFYERNYDGTMQTMSMTRPLWGIDSTSPSGHDGRSMTLDDVILSHGGESQASREAYRKLSLADSDALHKFLNSLILNTKLPAVRIWQHETDRPVQRSH